MAKFLNSQPGGVGQYFEGPIGAGVLVREVHHVTCHHCQGGTEFESKRAMMDHVEMCRGCMRLICLRCVGQPCVPAEKRAEIEEQQARLQARLQVGAWGCY